MPSPGSSASARCHSARSWDADDRSPSKPKARVSTRLTLPSRMAARSPKQKAATAAAVERPMPGSVASVVLLPGNRPPCRSTTACAQRCRLRARL